MRLTDFVNKDLICHQLMPKSKNDLLGLMVNHLCHLQPEIPKKALLENLIIREEENSTGIGNQIAIPHTTDKSITKTVCLIAQIPEGLDFESMDNQKILIAFLLVSPPGLMSEHIRLLSRIARVIKDHSVVVALSKASVEEALKLLAEEDSKHD